MSLSAACRQPPLGVTVTAAINANFTAEDTAAVVASRAACQGDGAAPAQSGASLTEPNGLIGAPPAIRLTGTSRAPSR